MTGVADVNGEFYDLKSLLCSKERDFLIRSNNDQVNIADLDGKTVGLFFSAVRCNDCWDLTIKLSEIYSELLKNDDFEVVLVTADRQEELFEYYLSVTPPWLAVPFSDSTTIDNLNEIFRVSEIPHLVILDRKGMVLTVDGVEVIYDHWQEIMLPYSRERLEELATIEAARRKQTLVEVLVSTTRGFLLSNTGNEVPLSELEGKIVGLYFSKKKLYTPCDDFTPKLAEIYRELKLKGKNFEIVFVLLGNNIESFAELFQPMPWLAVPLRDRARQKLRHYFDVNRDQSDALVIIGTDGRTLNPDAYSLFKEYGASAYPFSPAKFAELEKAKLESQTLESLLVTSERDFVIGHDGAKVPVAELVGKTILLYFSAQWCPPCGRFLPKLIVAYHEIKAKDSAFEVIFISHDSNQDSFDNFFARMPWLALPFGDSTVEALRHTFKFNYEPIVVAIGPEGRTITEEARKFLTIHGSDAYPFTERRLKFMEELEAAVQAEAKAWPKELEHRFHLEHVLVLTRHQKYACDGCMQVGYRWSFSCEECDFDLHPQCALQQG